MVKGKERPCVIEHLHRIEMRPAVAEGLLENDVVGLIDDRPESFESDITRAKSQDTWVIRRSANAFTMSRS